jgi:cell division protein FtsQ
MKRWRGRNWVQKTLWLGFYAAVAFTLYAAIQYKANLQVRQVNIEIIAEEGNRPLIAEEDVLRYINGLLDKDLESQKIEQLDVRKIEESLNGVRYIEKAEVFVNTKGDVFIVIRVRTPIVRIDRGDKAGFYLDVNGEVIPLSQRAAVRVPVANGYLGEFSADFMSMEGNRYRDVFELAHTVHQDPFLHALIEQIYVESNGKVILVPKLGRQKILFGELASVDHKFEKLKAFYKTGMPNAGWNRFKYLNLEWKDQVVGQY